MGFYARFMVDSPGEWIMTFTRKRKLYYNTAVSLLHQLVTLVCGFILPRFFLVTYGSEVNGLVSSVTQFLGFISLCECGVGAVVQSALYKPLADHDMQAVSQILKSSSRFFRKVAYILLAYVAVLTIAYPLITLGTFDYWYTASLILVIAVSTFAQYYFSISYRLLLNADQLAFVQLGIHTVVLILNTAVCVLLMNRQVSVQLVKLSTSLIYLLQPLFLVLFVRRRYDLNHKVILQGEPIPQKWNGLAQHVASVVLNNTDTVVLTLLSTLSNVSIYAVYYMIVNGVKQIVMSFTTGIQSLLGNMYAKREQETLQTTFSTIEWILHTAVTTVFTVTAILILPFVSIYTKDITDADYIVPVFAVLMILAQAAYCLRLPYNMMVLAAGHYKQTQRSAVVEAMLNIVLSVFLVLRYGLIGVAIGTLAAMLYRTFYFVWYLSRDILHREIRHFLKHMLVDLSSAGVMVFSTGWIGLQSQSYASWLWMAVQVGAICLAEAALINILAYRSACRKMWRYIRMGRRLK